MFLMKCFFSPVLVEKRIKVDAEFVNAPVHDGIGDRGPFEVLTAAVVVQGLLFG